MKNILPIVIILIIAVVFGYSFNKSKAIVSKQTTFVANNTIDVKGLNYSYDVKEIKVKLNDKIKINFTNTEGFHDFKIDEFNIATKQIKAGASESIEFVASKAGSFQYYCSVGQHRANGMWGTLVVE
jgi:plastocyanin